MKHLLKKIANAGLARVGLHLSRTPSYTQDGLVTVHNDHFRREPDFRRAYRRGVQAGNGVDPDFEWRVHVALWAAESSLRIPGDFVECGVNAGFVSSAIMHRLDWNQLNRRFFLIDTWNGPPLKQYNASEIALGRSRLAEDAMVTGGYVTDLERVHRNFAEWPGAVVVQGTVPEVLETVPATNVAFLHLDMNCAYPETAALNFFWGRLAPGAIVLLDDYAFRGHEQQAVAMDATASALGVGILSLPTGQGLIIK